jgi:4-hydroxybenzoate polyprenyltransferase
VLVFVSIIRLIRPSHWVKNSLVFAPLIFSGAYTQPESWIFALIGFAGFSLTASGVYAINDVLDAEYDRQHPVKKLRPVASGALSKSAALVLAFLFLSAGILLSLSLNLNAALFVAGYALVMLLYSVWLKHILLLDVLIIAAGLTTRALYGSAAIDVVISHWLVICAFLISMMLALVKRRQELVRIGDDTGTARRSLRKAPPINAWDQWINSIAGITILAYILYTVDSRTIEHVGSNHLLYTTPFVIYGIFRYLGQVQRTSKGEDPTEALIRDPAILVAVMAWLTVVLLVLSGIL